MARRSRGILACLVGVLLVGGGTLTFLYWPRVRSSNPKPTSERPNDSPSRKDDSDTYTVEYNLYTTPPDNDALLVDDRLADKKTAFDPELFDRRPEKGWLVNSSQAVIRLDVPVIKPDLNPELLVLHPSYAAAVKNAKWQVLPSVNMIDGKAKQFDDGLYAALDQAYYVGHSDTMKSHVKLVRRIYDKVAKGSPAADYLAAGLVLAKEPIETSPKAKSWAESFSSQEVFSKPIGVYTWTPKLSECFRVLRFYAMPIEDPNISKAIAEVLAQDKELRADYEKATGFYGKLTNPLANHSPAELIENPKLAEGGVISLFPPSSSREGELFTKLFPVGIPENADLMRELIQSIRSGKVDLKPRKNGGWYDYQVYALETLLLPETAPESNKLLLTKSYKKRMLEAFKALITKRRETHARPLPAEAPASKPYDPPPDELLSLEPRLRIEPNPTYYLRTARSYAFLANFLDSTLGVTTLKSLHGLREDGPREMDLAAELAFMRDLFYGLHLLSVEDIGAKPALLDGENVDRPACEKIASDWLKERNDDKDLAADTRVSVPVYYDPARSVTRLWMTIGVRLSPLDVNYASAPKVKPEKAVGDWKDFPDYKLRSVSYLIPIDEFAEVEIRGGRVLNRAELRAICDKMKTKPKIVEAIRSR